jgi:hypothetical protein
MQSCELLLAFYMRALEFLIQALCYMCAPFVCIPNIRLQAMSSPEQLARELEDVPALIDAQVAAGLDRDEVVQSLFRSWTARLSTCATMNDKGKTLMTQTIRHGPWDEQQVKDMASIILVGKPSAKSKASNRRPNQKCSHFENFIPMQTMIKLRDVTKYSQLSRASMLAGAARAIGIELPDQPTLYRVVSILAHTEQDFDYTQEKVFSLMDTIQQFIKSVPRMSSLPWLEHYPLTAATLPDEIRSAAFPDGELPVELEIPELAMVLGSHKMKGRDSTKKKAPDWLSSVPEDLRDTVLAAVQQGTVASPKEGRSKSSGASTPSAIASVPSEAPAGHMPVHTADVFRFAIAQQPAAPTQSATPTAETDPWEAEHANALQDAKTIEELETNMVAALKGRRADAEADTVARKPAAATDALKKRPSSSIGTHIKKPAAAARRVPKSSTWKLIHSRIFHQTRKTEFDKHGNDEKSKEAASRACTKAKVKFLNGTLKM